MGTFMKTKLLVFVVFVLGAGLGFVLALPSAVHAGAAMKLVRVTRLHVALGSGEVPVTGPVVGFTCSANADGTADCFIASQP
jgi:hypothetical protein